MTKGAARRTGTGRKHPSLRAAWKRAGRKITVSGQPVNSFTLDEYAYDTAGESLTAGQVPEPGSLAWLALGGAGLLAWRQRQCQALGSI